MYEYVALYLNYPMVTIQTKLNSQVYYPTASNVADCKGNAKYVTELCT